MDTIKVHISGMHCNGCATGIEMAAGELSGVKSSFVDLEGREGVFEVDASVVTAFDIIEAIKKLGYEAQEIAGP